MSIDEDIAILEQVPMLRVLGRAGIALDCYWRRNATRWKTGEVLFRPNERIDCAYVVQDGDASTSSVDPAFVSES